jgi:hypothetical protein
MLKRAHDEKAWQALGYGSWNDYVKAEIKLCRSRVFQLLDYETIRQELAESTIVDLPLPTKEAVTRELKKVEPEARAAAYASAVEAAGGKSPTARQVEAAVLEVLPPQNRKPIKSGSYPAFKILKDGSAVPHPTVIRALAEGGKIVEVAIPTALPTAATSDTASTKDQTARSIACDVLEALANFPVACDSASAALTDIEIKLRELRAEVDAIEREAE